MPASSQCSHPLSTPAMKLTNWLPDKNGIFLTNSSNDGRCNRNRCDECLFDSIKSQFFTVHLYSPLQCLNTSLPWRKALPHICHSLYCYREQVSSHLWHH